MKVRNNITRCEVLQKQGEGADRDKKGGGEGTDRCLDCL